MTTIRKDPAIDGYFGYDFASVLAGQALTSIKAVSVGSKSGLSPGYSFVNGAEALVFMAGGTLGTAYETTVLATRTDGRTLEAFGTILIASRPSPLVPPLGRLLVPTPPHALLTFPARYVDEVLDYGIDWSKYLAGDTLLSSTVEVVGDGAAGDISITRQSYDEACIYFWADGGTEGSTYLLKFEAFTALGRTIEVKANLVTLPPDAVSSSTAARRR